MRRTKAKVQMTRPEVGIQTAVAPGVDVVLAPNPGPMTHWGTNCYLVGDRELAIIDPGPDDNSHITNLMTAIGSRKVTHILVTHAHADHSAGAKTLSTLTGAPVLGFGAAHTGRRAVMRQLASDGSLGGGEGIDADFAPDRVVQDGDQITGSDWELEVLHLPGHFAGHLGFQLGDILFCGDHMMDWSSSIVSPPDGHLGDFFATCRRLTTRAPAQCLSGHGGPLRDPVDRLEGLMAHRKNRERQILDSMSDKPMPIDDIVARVYLDVPQHLHPAAARNVLAHLIDLWERRIVEPIPAMKQDATFRLI